MNAEWYDNAVGIAVHLFCAAAVMESPEASATCNDLLLLLLLLLLLRWLESPDGKMRLH